MAGHLIRLVVGRVRLYNGDVNYVLVRIVWKGVVNLKAGRQWSFFGVFVGRNVHLYRYAALVLCASVYFKDDSVKCSRVDVYVVPVDRARCFNWDGVPVNAARRHFPLVELHLLQVSRFFGHLRYLIDDDGHAVASVPWVP